MGSHTWHGDAHEDCLAIAKNFLWPPRAGPTQTSCSSFPQENAEGASYSKVAQAVMPKASCCGKQPRKNVLSL